MPRITRTFISLLAASLALGGCATMPGGAGSRVALVPEGRSVNAPYVVGYVKRGSPATDSVTVGDTVLSVGGAKVTTSTFFKEIQNRPAYATVQDKSGHTRRIALTNLVNSRSGQSYIMPFKRGGTFLFSLKIPAYGHSQSSGYIVVGHESGVVAASIWHSSPRIVEVYIRLTASSNCNDCAIKYVGLLDVPYKSWLAPISPKEVAMLLYPQAGSPPQMVNVPPPVKVGSTTISNTNGAYQGSVYGNNLNGNYYGTTTSTTVPYYNYTATNMAMAQNLASMIAREKIIQNNRNRRKFILDRIGNFHAGQMNPGETEAAYFDFAVPKGMKGPFAVAISDGKHTSYVTFKNLKQ